MTSGTAVGSRQEGRRATAREYILGNGGAVAFGLLVCYAALTVTGAISTMGWDFFFYYAPGRLILQGHGGQLYDLGAIRHIEAVLAHPIRVPQGAGVNVDPPFFCLALAPLAALPYNLAYALWLILDCALLTVSVYALERYADLPPRASLYLRLGMFASLPVLIALLQGQTTMLMLGALVGAWLALKAGREIVAGAALSVLLIKPQYILPFVLLLALRGHWRALSSLAVCAAVLFVAPMAVLGPSIDGGYFHTLRLAAGWGKEVSGFAPVWNRSFAGFTGLVLPGFLASLVAVALDVVTLALFIRLALRRVPFDVLFGLAVVVALLTSQHVLIHDLSLLCIPVAVALRYRSIGPGHLITLLIAADIGVTAGFPLALAVPVQLPTIVMVALAGWLYEAGRSAGREVSATMSTCPLVAEGATAGD